MAIKTITVPGVKKNGKSYPKIMKNHLYTILFSTDGSGVILEVHDGKHSEVGNAVIGIPMTHYTDHDEPITIQTK